MGPGTLHLVMNFCYSTIGLHSVRLFVVKGALLYVLFCHVHVASVDRSAKVFFLLLSLVRGYFQKGLHLDGFAASLTASPTHLLVCCFLVLTILCFGNSMTLGGRLLKMSIEDVCCYTCFRP